MTTSQPTKRTEVRWEIWIDGRPVCWPSGEEAAFTKYEAYKRNNARLIKITSEISEIQEDVTPV